MDNAREDRINKLSERFKTHTTGRPRNNKNRERQSFYLDADLTDKMDRTYKDLAHQFYPKSVSKSQFLETILEFGLEHLDDIRQRITDVVDSE